MEKLFDLAEFEALAMGDTDFIKELLAANIESIEEGIQVITESYEAGDLDAAGQAAHKIKPLLAMLRVGAVHQSVVDIEYYGRKEYNPAMVEKAYSVFSPQAPILLQQLKDELSS